MSKDRQWDMPRRAEHCSQCEREFAIGEPFHACLYAGPDGFQRRDYCQDCPIPEAPAALATWRTARPAPANPRVQPFDRETLYTFFTRLEDATAAEQLEFRFVLALLLWRKKVLKLDRSITDDDGELWLFAATHVDAEHRVRRPELDEARLEDLSTQLEALLAGHGSVATRTIPPVEEDIDA